MQAHFGGAYTNTFYIPDRVSVRMLLAMTAFVDHEVHHALAVPAALGVLSEDASDYQVTANTTSYHYWEKDTLPG